MRSASLFFGLLAACTDAANPNDGSDDNVISQSPGPMTLTLTHAGQPAEGVRVVFQDRNSEILADVLTDATGLAEGLMTRGGFVSVVEWTWFGTVTTFTDVSRGDHLVVDGLVHHAQPTEVPTETVDFTMIVPRAEAPFSLDYRVVAAGCGTSTNHPTIAETAETVTFSGAVDHCTMPVDLLIEAAFGLGNQYKQTLFVPNVTILDGDTLDLTDKSFLPLVQVPFTVDIPPGRAWSYGVGLNAGLGVVGGAAGPTEGCCPPAFNEDATFIIDVPQLPPSETEVVLESYGATSHTVHGSGGPLGPGSTGSVSFNANPIVLSDVPNCPVLDLGEGNVTWETTAEGRSPTVVLLELDWHPNAPEWWRWKLVAPRDGTVRLPRLPDDVVDLSIVDPAEVTLMMYRIDAPIGHAEVRDGVTWPRDSIPWKFGTAMTRTGCTNGAPF